MESVFNSLRKRALPGNLRAGEDHGTIYLTYRKQWEIRSQLVQNNILITDSYLICNDIVRFNFPTIIIFLNIELGIAIN